MIPSLDPIPERGVSISPSSYGKQAHQLNDLPRGSRVHAAGRELGWPRNLKTQPFTSWDATGVRNSREVPTSGRLGQGAGVFTGAPIEEDSR
jgi:hypothetical protein